MSDILFSQKTPFIILAAFLLAVTNITPQETLTKIGSPDVLILDEPTSGIDIGGEETIYSLLHKFWQNQNLTILLVTHDLNIVWEYATQVICLNKQQMCMGKPDEVLTPEQLKTLYGTGVKFYKHQHR